MRKILVTGATGFIGGYVIKELLNVGYDVIATSTNEEKAREKDWIKDVDYVCFDFKEFDESQNYLHFFHYPEALIHLAWGGLPNYKSPFHLQENLPRHFAFLSSLIKNGLSDMTITGTCLEYGMQEGALREDMPVSPSNPYAIAKNELRKLLELLKQQYPFSLKWVRLFYLYGKGQNPNSLLSQLDKALANGEPVFNMTNGDQTRDYLTVEKVASYLVAIATQNEVTGIINCCSGTPVSVKDFVEKRISESGAKIELNLGFYPYPEYEPKHFWGDNNKLKTILKHG